MRFHCICESLFESEADPDQCINFASVFGKKFSRLHHWRWSKTTSLRVSDMKITARRTIHSYNKQVAFLKVNLT